MSLVGEDPLLSSEQLISTMLQNGDMRFSVFLGFDMDGNEVLLHSGDVKCVRGAFLFVEGNGSSVGDGTELELNVIPNGGSEEVPWWG
jgi:hypothetical protein